MGLISKAQSGVSDTMPVKGEPEKEEVEGLTERASREPESAEDDDLTPEEREAYEAAMKMASEMLHKSDDGFKSIMTELSNGDITETAPEVVSFIIEQIETAFQGQVPEGIILPLADEISDLVMELVDAAGIAELDEATAKDIKSNTVKMLLDDYGVDEAQMQEAMQGVSESDLADIQKMYGG